MSVVWPMLLGVLIGVALSQQPVINGAVSQVLNSVFAAATLSLGLSALVVFALFWVTGAPTRPAQLMDLPWWTVFAGFIGAFFVAGSAMIVPITGAALFFVCLIAGQLVGAVAADAIGAFGMEPRPVSLTKLAGVALGFAGVVLVKWG